MLVGLIFYEVKFQDKTKKLKSKLAAYNNKFYGVTPEVDEVRIIMKVSFILVVREIETILLTLYTLS